LRASLEQEVTLSTRVLLQTLPSVFPMALNLLRRDVAAALEVLGDQIEVDAAALFELIQGIWLLLDLLQYLI
jgi:hypothetical protein